MIIKSKYLLTRPALILAIIAGFSLSGWPFSSHAQVQATGDFMLAQSPNNALPLKNLESILNHPGYINLINLEGAIAPEHKHKLFTSGKCFFSKSENCFAFKMDTKTASILRKYNFSIINLANNHFFDYGINGANITVEEILKADMHPIGISNYFTQTKIINNKKFTFIGASPHKNTVSTINDLPIILDEIKKQKDSGSIVIFTAHLGREANTPWVVENKDEIYLGYNRGNTYKIAHSVIDAGADAFIGHGPHVLRPIEIYKDRIIAYSLGNFLTTGAFNLDGNYGLGGIIRINFNDNGSFLSGEFHGTQQLKKVDNKKWSQGEYIDFSSKADDFLKEITQKQFPNQIKWDKNKFYRK